MLNSEGVKYLTPHRTSFFFPAWWAMRSSQNSVNAKFGEDPFHEVG